MNLLFFPALKHKELLPQAVAAFIEKFDTNCQIKVAQINPEFADGDSLSREYDIPYEMEVNCLVVEGRRSDDKRYAALLVPYGKRAKTNATVKRPLDAAKLGFADLDYVVETTGMAFGAITPIGLPADWLILMDAALLEQEQLVVGGGLVQSKLLIPSSLLAKLPNVQVIEGLAKD